MRSVIPLGIVAVVATSIACGGDLPSASLVDGVRILATQADLPYAKPGERVSLQALAVDGRADRPQPMRVFWLPAPCMNPSGDDYFACYPAFAKTYPPGVDLSGALTPGDGFSFTMPADAIATAQSHPGAPDPYGIAFVFLVACAGTVEYVPIDPDAQGPTTTPFGCFDASHTALGASDFVFAFTRVYAYADRRNANPVIDAVTYGGTTVDPAQGISVAHCTASSESSCPSTDVDTVVPDSSWELDPGSLNASGGEVREAIWVDYYAAAGSFANDSVLLFDANSGRVASTADGYAAPTSPGAQTMWVVVHDTRGGASWVTLPVGAR